MGNPEMKHREGCRVHKVKLALLVMASRSLSVPAVPISAGEAVVDGFPPVLVLYHPTMQKLAGNIVDSTSARLRKLSVSEASYICTISARVQSMYRC